MSSLPRSITPAKPRRGAKAYLGASVLSQVCALLRYVLLARLLGPEQLGIAATLILTASFFDLISDTAADRFLIQDKDGDQVPVQRLVQLVLAGRGVSIAAAMAAVAWPLAFFYRTPALAPALAVLGLSPLIMGFIHLDMRRAQRENDFRAEGLSTMASEAAGLLGTVLAAYLTHNFTAVLYGLIARSLVLVVCSHLFANRPYGVGYSKEHGPRLGRFSAPLMVTGMILFLAGQGDRVLVGEQKSGFAGLGHRLLARHSAVLFAHFLSGRRHPQVRAHSLSTADRRHTYRSGQTLRSRQRSWIPDVAARARDDCRLLARCALYDSPSIRAAAFSRVRHDRRPDWGCSNRPASLLCGRRPSPLRWAEAGSFLRTTFSASQPGLRGVDRICARAGIVRDCGRFYFGRTPSHRSGAHHAQ